MYTPQLFTSHPRRNTELVECLLAYVKEAPEDYADWLADAAVSTIRYQNDDFTMKFDSVPDKAHPLANQAHASLLCSPSGLACCLDNVKIKGPSVSDVNFARGYEIILV